MCYFGIIFKDLSSVVDVVAHQLNDPILERVNLLVGIGLSGTMPLLSIRERTGIEVIALHKPKSMSHAQVLWEVNSLGWDVNNPPESYDHRYVILDDFVGQGNTVRAIQETMSKYFPGSKCVGVLLYSHYGESGLRKMCQCPSVPIFQLRGVVEEVAALKREEQE